MAVLNLRKGDDLMLVASFTSASSAHDMTGWIVMAQIAYSNCTPVDLTVTWTDAATGEAVVSLTEEKTLQLHVEDYLLQIRAVSPDGVTISTMPTTIRVRD